MFIFKYSNIRSILLLPLLFLFNKPLNVIQKKFKYSNMFIFKYSNLFRSIYYYTPFFFGFGSFFLVLVVRTFWWKEIFIFFWFLGLVHKQGNVFSWFRCGFVGWWSRHLAMMYILSTMRMSMNICEYIDKYIDEHVWEYVWIHVIIDEYLIRYIWICLNISMNIWLPYNHQRHPPVVGGHRTYKWSVTTPPVG